MSGRDTWPGETPEEMALRMMWLNDYANAVTACQMAFAKLEKLTGKTKKEEASDMICEYLMEGKTNV